MTGDKLVLGVTIRVDCGSYATHGLVDTSVFLFTLVLPRDILVPLHPQKGH